VGGYVKLRQLALDVNLNVFKEFIVSGDALGLDREGV
jgi:hypothetical protein